MAEAASQPAAYSEFNGVCVDFIRQAFALTECGSNNESSALPLLQCSSASKEEPSKTTSIESYLEDFVQKLRLRNVQPSEKGHVVHNGFSGPKEHTNIAAAAAVLHQCCACEANLLAKMLAMTLLQKISMTQ